MISQGEIYNVDGFRFINHLNTTSRQLNICSKIIYELGSTMKLKSSLYKSLIEWSTKREKFFEEYANSKGKITNHGKPTSAFDHYLDLCKSLGLINDINGLFANTRLSYILTYILGERDTDTLSLSETIFYFYLLMIKDADGILLLLDLLREEEISQNSLQKKFHEHLSNRLLAKINSSVGHVKSILSEKYRSINYIWKSPEKYAEHLIVPRCEWLNQLGLVSIKRVKSSTLYSLTDRGKITVSLLPRLKISNLIDVDENWLMDNVFTLISEVFSSSFVLKSKHYNDTLMLNLGESLETASIVIKSSNSFRIPAFDALFFVCSDMLVKKNIIVNFSDIVNLLKNGINYENKLFLIRNVGRINESYITTRHIL